MLLHITIKLFGNLPPTCIFSRELCRFERSQVSGQTKSVISHRSSVPTCKIKRVASPMKMKEH